MMNNENEWMQVAWMEDVPEGGTCQVFLQQEPVCLYRLGDAVYATHDQCTHGNASLTEGYVDGENIECPLHQGLFHIPTGKAIGMPCVQDVRVYPIKVVGNAVYLQNIVEP